MRMDRSMPMPGAGGWPAFAPLRARGLYRLGQFAALSVAALLRGRRRGELDFAAAAAFGHDLAEKIVERLGIHVTFTGERPRGLRLLVSNHRSYMDIPVLMSAAPAIFLAKEEIGAWPLVGSVAAMARTIFVDRDSRSSRKRALAAIRQTLVAGTPVALFPEGTTTRGPGILPFRPGSFWLASELGLPVVPVAISYADPANAWIDDDPFVGHFVRQLSAPTVDIRVGFGPPLMGRDGFALRDAAEEWIREELALRDAITFGRTIVPLAGDDDEGTLPRTFALPGGFAPAT
jgi:1-acyl-sn-glycerol-3-phosphate acyltransferase